MLGRLKKSAMGADISVTSAANDPIGAQPKAAYKHTICKLGKAFRKEWVAAVTEYVAYLATPMGKWSLMMSRSISMMENSPDKEKC